MSSLVARDLQNLFGLPTSYTLIILIGVPVFIVVSTGVLLYYYFRARASKRARDRAASKSTLNTSSTDHDQEMALTSIGATFRPLTSGDSRPPYSSFSSQPFANQYPQESLSNHHSERPFTNQSFGFDKPERPPRPVVAGHVKGSGSEVFDVQQYESERANERVRNMLLPSPSFAPSRPRTAPSTGRSERSYDRPVDYSRTYNDSSIDNTTSSRDHASPYSRAEDDQPRGRGHRRSASLGKPPPIRPPRPTHSPAGSVRSLSIFPPKHNFPNTPSHSPTATTHSTTQSPPPGHTSPPILSPNPYQQGHQSPPLQSPTSNYAPSPPVQSPTTFSQRNISPSALTPSPPLLSPIPTHRSPPKPPPHKKHGRHPSIDRNSLMPIAPILLPPEPAPRTILSAVEERPDSARGYYEGVSMEFWRDKSRDNYI